MPKVTPMLFSGELIRALLAGNKAQTRRIMKPQPKLKDDGVTHWWPSNIMQTMLTIEGRMDQSSTRDIYPDFVAGESCPFGGIGDLIYVRETFRLFNSADECGCADFPCPCPNDNTPIYRANFNDREAVWKPSIHMPRLASRLTLKITDVRVERIQDISEDDAWAEGVDRNCVLNIPVSDAASAEFSRLWESVYPDSWDKNEWVWVMDFEVINKNIDLVLAEMEKAA